MFSPFITLKIAEDKKTNDKAAAKYNTLLPPNAYQVTSKHFIVFSALH